MESFEKGLSLFSQKLIELIKKFILIDINKRHEGDWDKIILREFLNARVFNFNKSPVICPLLELVNHDVTSLPFISYPDGLSTPNYLPINGEITHNYSNKSPLNRFSIKDFLVEKLYFFHFHFL